MTDEDKALIVALELLRKSVADMTAAIVANATRAGRAADPFALPDGTPVEVPVEGQTPPDSPAAAGNTAAFKDMAASLKAWLANRANTPEQRAALPTGKVEDIPGDSGMIGRAVSGIKTGIVGALSGAGAMLAARFSAMLGPTALFGQVVQSAGSGFQVLNVAIKVLAATLAPILLPIVFSLAVALTELSDTVWSKVKPILQGLYQIIAATILPVFRLLADVLGTLIGGIASVIGALGSAVSWIAKQFSSSAEKTQRAIDLDNEWRRATGGPESGAVTGKTARGELMGGADKRDSFDKMIGGMASGKASDEVMKSLMMSMMPKAQTMGVSAAFSSAREKALNQDPLEAKMLKVQMESLAELKKANDRAAKGEAAYTE